VEKILLQNSNIKIEFFDNYHKDYNKILNGIDVYDKGQKCTKDGKNYRDKHVWYVLHKITEGLNIKKRTLLMS
jgi:hypothetical protein